MHDSDYKLILTSPKWRESLITKILCKSNWQHNKTPIDIVDKMISKTNLKNKNILVLFNMEFVERLINKFEISPKNIFFFSDNENKRFLVETYYGVKFISGNAELINSKNKGNISLLTRRIIKMGQKKFDLCFSNPPYNKGVDLKIINAVEPLCEEMVIVHPSTWLLSQKVYKPFIKFKKSISKYLKSIEFFNGNPVFNIGLFVPCVITHLNKHFKRNIKISDKCNNQEYEVKNINDITKFGTDWKPIVKPFMNQIKKYIEKNGHVWEHNIKEINDGKFYYCQLAAIRGTPYRGTNIKAKYLLNDFYTLIMKDSDKNEGIRQPKLHGTGSIIPTFKFDTEQERYNFIHYLKTDFARFCLSLLKHAQTLYAGELKLIPWMNFTQKWDDEKLYKFFDVNKETIDYIENYLPDFYGIHDKKENN